MQCPEQPANRDFTVLSSPPNGFGLYPFQGVGAARHQRARIRTTEGEKTLRTTLPRRARYTRRITVHEWLGDARDARKSAKSGIPAVGDPLPTPTGRQSEIGRAADHRIATLRSSTQTATADQEAELAKLTEQIRQIEAHIDDASAKESAILERAVDRLPIEAEVPDAVVAARRAADHRREAAPLRRQIEGLSVERDRLAAQAARLDHEIVMAWRQARAEARAVGDLARRREARYWRLLCRRHPDGAQLATAFDHPRIALAPWVEGPADERSL